MGTKQWGNSTPPSGGTFFMSPSGDAVKANNGITTNEGGYVDSVRVFCGAHNGGNSHFRGGIYTTGNNLLAQTGVFDYGTGYGFNIFGFTAGSYPHIGAGVGIVGAVLAYGQALQVQGYNDGGTFQWWDAGSATSLPQPWASSGTVSSVGNLGWYITYFPDAQVTSIPSTPVQPGASFTVNGLSFSAGVTDVSVGGISCAFSVVNDTTLTVTAPSQGVQGQVQVTTNAGTATSSGTMIVGEVWWGNAGAVSSIVAVKFGDASNNGVVHPAVGIWVPVGSPPTGVKRIW